MTSRAGPELEELIGEEALVRLAEAFGGTPLFIPQNMAAKHPIAEAIGLELAVRLSKRLAPDVINVPLAREPRARQYRDAGQSNAQIARRLGMTVKGVERLFARIRQQDMDLQPTLFDR